MAAGRAQRRSVGGSRKAQRIRCTEGWMAVGGCNGHSRPAASLCGGPNAQFTVYTLGMAAVALQRHTNDRFSTAPLPACHPPLSSPLPDCHQQLSAPLPVHHPPLSTTTASKVAMSTSRRMLCLLRGSPRTCRSCRWVMPCSQQSSSATCEAHVTHGFEARGSLAEASAHTAGMLPSRLVGATPWQRRPCPTHQSRPLPTSGR